MKARWTWAMLALLAAQPLLSRAANTAAETLAKAGPVIAVQDWPAFGVYAGYLEETYGMSAAKAAEAAGQKGARKFLVMENDALDGWQANRRAWENYLLRQVEGQARPSENAIRRFVYRHPSQLRFYRFPRLSNRLRLVRSDYLTDIFAKGGWDNFWERYPGSSGLISFTSIGWSDDQREAVFSVRMACGELCGYRDLVVMRWIGRKWRVIYKVSLP